MSNHDPLDTEALEAHTSSLAEEQKALSRQEADDFKWLMSDKRGRRYMWRQLEKTGVFRSSFTSTSNETFFREGERNVGLRLLALINVHCPDRYNQMVTENQS